ncbi:DUF2239 family protein [Microvirga subterranea]|uniref:DUF2239 family protein n=1 Tax=Microvirga subterranea TaxID=186651 RepID=A0A370HIT6_9HYPH|nr:DUF2239 family protein [Microvirga subterranea]RDI58044.1 hypothetical protein DES45_106358 [Microvirga subterranea]
MTAPSPLTYSAFRGPSLLARDTLPAVALAVKRASKADPTQTILIFDDATGQQIDLDLRGDDEAILARLAPTGIEAAPPAAPRGRGRPKLGVTAREVTLLPRQWEWLGAQPGGASATLRRLVDEARRKDAQSGRSARNAAYAFMAAMAGNLPGFEEASRALFANDRDRFEALVATWPGDVRIHTIRMAFGPRDE